MATKEILQLFTFIPTFVVIVYLKILILIYNM